MTSATQASTKPCRSQVTQSVLSLKLLIPILVFLFTLSTRFLLFALSRTRTVANGGPYTWVLPCRTWHTMESRILHVPAVAAFSR
jgi:hypothetical protein